jgi:crotonobetainyl-CoA:carnitine CoA-transferase CaiB-like acyl-CoA transferase
MPPTAEAPLAGVRVLDLTRLLPGGYATLLMADMGAEVVKVEEPGKGDYIRWSPPMVDGESAQHRALNRGKRSLTLNLKAPEGPELLQRLAERADVLIESFRPGVMSRLGVGWETLSERNPRLVYCAITGYGQDGPYRDRAGHDLNYMGFAGAASITGPRGGPPVVPGVQVGDIGGGALSGVAGILAALFDRERTGRGRFVDASMMDGAFSWLSMHLGAFLADGEVPEPSAMRLSGANACYRVYRTKDDRFLTVGALEPQFWRALCEALGVPDLIERQYGPIEDQDEVAERLQAVLGTKTRDEWVAELSDLDACVGPVNDFGEAVRDPQVRARDLVAVVDGVEVGPGPPVKFSPPAPAALRPAPGMGADTEEFLGEIGVAGEELQALRARGVV